MALQPKLIPQIDKGYSIRSRGKTGKTFFPPELTDEDENQKSNCGF
jgi:hypothetical protein